MTTTGRQGGNTIDLIEDCLEQIHRCRKAALLARARKFREKEAKLRSSHNPYNVGSNLSSRHPTIDYDKEEEEDEEEREELKDLSSKFSAPPPKVIPLAPVDYSISYAKEATPDDDADDIAVDAYTEFATEITAWLNNHSKDVVEDDDIRADFADHLVHFYLSSNLDKLPASKKVVEIRKAIANTVEEFVSSGKMKLNVSTLKMQNSIKTGSLEKTSSKTKPSVSNADSSKKNGTAKLADPEIAGVTVPAVDKKKFEKQKIKEQYESFMNMKKKADVHPDNDTMKQYADLNDDIQSLLSSIQATTNK